MGRALSKFISGAAKQGAAIFDRQAAANIMAERDAIQEQMRQKARKQETDIANKHQTARDETQHQRLLDRDKASHEREMGIIDKKHDLKVQDAKSGIGGNPSSRSEYGRAYDDLIRTRPGITQEEASRIAFNMTTQGKTPSLLEFVQKNMDSTLTDSYGSPRMVSDSGEEREMTRGEAEAELIKTYKKYQNPSSEKEKETGDTEVDKAVEVYKDVASPKHIQYLMENPDTLAQFLSVYAK